MADRKPAHEQIHPSHDIESRSTIISLPSNDRFGMLYTCKRCGGELATVVTGDFWNDDCPSLRERCEDEDPMHRVRRLCVPPGEAFFSPKRE